MLMSFLLRTHKLITLLCFTRTSIITQMLGRTNWRDEQDRRFSQPRGSTNLTFIYSNHSNQPSKPRSATILK